MGWEREKPTSLKVNAFKMTELQVRTRVGFDAVGTYIVTHSWDQSMSQARESFQANLDAGGAAHFRLH